MLDNLFSQVNFSEVWLILKSEFPLAIFETVYVTLIATFLALVIGLPLGVILALNQKGEKKGILNTPPGILSLLNGIINLLRSVPFLILMIMVFPLTRFITGTTVGTVASIVPLVVAAFPFMARLLESAFREVDQELLFAVKSMGASNFQIIIKVLIPESFPSLISNFTIAITTILGYTAMSGILGGGGLGKIAINYGYYRYQTTIMILAVLLLILLVAIFQGIGDRLAKKIDKRNL